MSKEYVPSLEDFLKFEDTESDTDPTNDGDDMGIDPSETDVDVDPTIEEDNPVVETPEIIVDEQGEEDTSDVDTGDSVEPEETLEEADSEEDDQEEEQPETGNNQIDTVFNVMNQSGLLALNEGFEFDGSVDKLIDAVNQTKQNMEMQAAESLWSRLPEDFRSVLEYGLAGGTDLEVVKEVTNNQVNLNKINIENEDHQKQLVEAYLRKTTKFSDNKINKRIKVLHESDLLEDEATEAYNELKVIQEEEKQKLVQQEVERQRLEQQELEKAYHAFTGIAKDMDVSDTRKQQIVDAVWNVGKYDGENEMSYIEHVDDMVRNNPEHFAQLVNIYLDYDPNKGFKVTSKSSRKANTQAAKNLRNTLQDLLSGNAAVTATSATENSGNNSGFDFEKFIKHS
jgi:hypothetical protein